MINECFIDCFFINKYGVVLFVSNILEGVLFLNLFNLFVDEWMIGVLFGYEDIIGIVNWVCLLWVEISVVGVIFIWFMGVYIFELWDYWLLLWRVEVVCECFVCDFSILFVVWCLLIELIV